MQDSIIQVTGRYFKNQFVYQLPLIDGITLPSWYSDIQLQDLEKLWIEGIEIQHLTLADIGAGSLITDLILASLNSHIYCYEPSVNFEMYLNKLEQFYSNQFWWKNITALNEKYTQFCKSRLVPTFDIIISNMPSSPFPVCSDEIYSITNLYKNSIRPAPFSDGGYFGFELMYSFVSEVAPRMRTGAYLMIQLPECARLPGNNVINATADVFKKSQILLYRIYTHEIEILPNSIVGTRLQLFKERLNWKPNLINNKAIMRIISFVGRKL